MYGSIYKKVFLCFGLLVAAGSSAHAQSNTGSVQIGGTLTINYFWTQVSIPSTITLQRVIHRMHSTHVGSTEVFADIEFGALVTPWVKYKGIKDPSFNWGTTKTLASADLEFANALHQAEIKRRVFINGNPFTPTSWPLVHPNDIIRIETYMDYTVVPLRFQLDWTYTMPVVNLTASGSDVDFSGWWSGLVLLKVETAIVSSVQAQGPPPISTTP